MSGFTFKSAGPGRWTWTHPSGQSGTASDAAKQYIERRVAHAAVERAEKEERARVELEARLEETHDAAFLLGFAAGEDANPSRVEIIDGKVTIAYSVAPRKPTMERASVDSLGKWQQDLVTTAEQLAAREKVVAGRERVLAKVSEPMPADLERREREVARREAEWQKLDLYAPEFLREWEDRLNYGWQEYTKHNEQLQRDRAALDRTRAQLLSDGTRES